MKAPPTFKQIRLGFAGLTALIVPLVVYAQNAFFHTIRGVSFVAPASISLNHTANRKTFTVTWSAGSGNGTCKIQYTNSSGAFADVLSPASLNCDANVSSTTITLPSTSPWTAAGQARSVRILRISDSTVLGTFATNLNCNSLGGSASPTSTIDEDCNGAWDNTTSSTSSGCASGSACVRWKESSTASCSDGTYGSPECMSDSHFLRAQGYGCKDFSGTIGSYASIQSQPASSCSSTTYTYY